MEILSQNSKIVWRIFRTKSPDDASLNSLQNSVIRTVTNFCYTLIFLVKFIKSWKRILTSFLYNFELYLKEYFKRVRFFFREINFSAKSKIQQHEKNLNLKKSRSFIKIDRLVTEKLVPDRQTTHKRSLSLE